MATLKHADLESLPPSKIKKHYSHNNCKYSKLKIIFHFPTLGRFFLFAFLTFVDKNDTGFAHYKKARLHSHSP